MVDSLRIITAPKCRYQLSKSRYTDCDTIKQGQGFYSKRRMKLTNRDEFNYRRGWKTLSQAKFIDCYCVWLAGADFFMREKYCWPTSAGDWC